MGLDLGSLKIQIVNGYCYLLWLFGAAVGVRLSMGLLRTVILRFPPTKDLYAEQEEDTFLWA